MKIAIVGMGYVGLSLAVLLARHNAVYAVDIVPEKVERINRRQSPVRDREIEEFLASRELSLTATTDGDSVYPLVDYVIVSTPTDYDPGKDSFDTAPVESVIERVLRVNPEACVVVKSTVPIGFTRRMWERFHTKRILFSPEFLREGRALYDNLYPHRIIVGVDRDDADAVARATAFSELLRQGAQKRDVEVLLMGSEDAEAVKLFANTYLALRVAFFNELDTFAEVRGLETEAIIRGVCLDPRIGLHYNNPSFGYGGYCLPKDTRQLLADSDGNSGDLVAAVVKSNGARKRFIAERALQKAASRAAEGGRENCVIGVYRLIMKAGSDNFRQSAILDVIAMLTERAAGVVIYEPELSEASFMGCEVMRDLDAFAARCDLILANRRAAELEPFREKVYSRDLFSID